MNDTTSVNERVDEPVHSPFIPLSVVQLTYVLYSVHKLFVCREAEENILILSCSSLRFKPPTVTSPFFRQEPALMRRLLVLTVCEPRFYFEALLLLLLLPVPRQSLKSPCVGG